MKERPTKGRQDRRQEVRKPGRKKDMPDGRTYVYVVGVYMYLYKRIYTDFSDTILLCHIPTNIQTKEGTTEGRKEGRKE